MEPTHYSVIITGEILDDFQLEQVIQDAAKLFKCSEDKARTLFQGNPFPLKKNLEKAVADKYIGVLHKIGVASHLAPKVEAPTELSLEPLPEPTPPADAPGPSTADAGNAVPTGGMILEPMPPKPQPAAAPIQPSTADADEEEEEDDFNELMIFVGDKSEDYRLKFKELNDNGGSFKLQWNWATFFLPIPWLVYRKMYLMAALFTLALPLIIAFVPYFGVLLALVLPGLLGNYLYFQHARKKISAITDTGINRKQALHAAGGVNSILIPIVATIPAGMVMSAIFYNAMMAHPASKQFRAALEDARKNQAAVDKLHDPKEKGTMARMMLLKPVFGLYTMREEMAKKSVTLPEDMDDLAKMLRLPEKNRRDAWGHDLTLVNEDGVVTLYSAGIDGKFDTEDDLSYTITEEKK